MGEEGTAPTSLQGGMSPDLKMLSRSGKSTTSMYLAFQSGVKKPDFLKLEKTSTEDPDALEEFDNFNEEKKPNNLQ